MNDSTASLTLHNLRYPDGGTIRAARHPVHGRLMMAHDVLKAIGYEPKPPHGTRPVLAGLRVSDANRVTLRREDFDTAGKKAVPTFDRAAFLTHAGLKEIAANAAEKRVKTFGPWMADVMENGAPAKGQAKTAVRGPVAATEAASIVPTATGAVTERTLTYGLPKPPEGYPWDDA
ncbi:hypothetical protein MWN34_17245 [Ancylobacter sp. 6x-1]|uniref:Uncharacterized protein n=1 Tax=Ancylobacter crimeensis TaxID=2579147 RepID=A0ABT0DFA8_9HYPH|nr:hypothetical protein [Ancylobacter crimeensis]MCK0198645.1 hypothetical protein [Ancylobacter crimeensis]